MKKFVLAAACAVALMNCSAQAALLTYSFAGHIFEARAYSPVLQPPDALAKFSVGQSFSGTLTYDTDAAEGPFRALNPNRNQANYPSALVAFEVHSGNYSYVLSEPASINVADGLYGSSTDIFSAIAGGPWQSTYQVYLGLVGSDNSIIGFGIPSSLTTAAFPSMELSLSFLPSAVGGSMGIVDGPITLWTEKTTVPEPNGALLFLFGIAVMHTNALCARRQRRQKQRG